MKYIYNEQLTIRTNCELEKIYSTNKGFIARLENVEYKQNDDSWKSVGSRWLINCVDIQDVMNNGFKAVQL
ncbi:MULTISPECIES: hypothetical protein [Photobacterium]|uniref:Uncharacterized protein n=1 Tax=Photobacterium carnosum TaxID=2023717 RepID=A0A2N4ULV8_9GAMM|nr:MULTISPECIES: hypothetical protein [Photobacterium]MCD9465523.1 hypothetical protein [Photobacterium phosphoreum]PLC55996.1 hypothetical protein CIK00_20775 [Photobacterium carnosum]